LYFYDTGLVCSLVGFDSAEHVKTYHSKGALFENLIINELIKEHLHKGVNPRFFYWQKVTGDVSGVLNVIYVGDTNLGTEPGNFISWRSLKDFVI